MNFTPPPGTKAQMTADILDSDVQKSKSVHNKLREFSLVMHQSKPDSVIDKAQVVVVYLKYMRQLLQ